MDMKKTIFFDLYSTLIYEKPATKFYSELIKELGVENTEFMYYYRLHGNKTMAGKLEGMMGRVSETLTSLNMTTPKNISNLISKLQPLYDNAITTYSDTLETLDKIRQKGFKIGLISNASSYTEPLLKGLGIKERIDVSILSYRVGILKPSKEIYLYACRQLDEKPLNCVYVGDGGDEELYGAKVLGFETILVDRKLPHSDSAKAHADIAVKHLNEIPFLLRKIV